MKKIQNNHREPEILDETEMNICCLAVAVGVAQPQSPHLSSVYRILLEKHQRR